MNAQTNLITRLFNIQYPIVQAGMVWCSGWELASAASNAGALGVLGSGSMYPDILRQHIKKCKSATDKSFAVNVPLLYPDIEEQMKVIVEEGVKYVFTSAGNPRAWTETLKKEGIIVAHVVSSEKFAAKAEAAGVDAIVAEGFEAGGHNGREETTSMVLIPSVRDKIELPLIAAGGISDGRSMFAAMALGADAVQIGSRFVMSEESSAHENFKEAVAKAQEGDTRLSLKEITPVRLLKNEFATKVMDAEGACASIEELKNLLGRGRAKKGMFEGDMNEGELEIGQVSGRLNKIQPAREIVEEIYREFLKTKDRCQGF